MLQQETYWRQRARVQWIKEGDRNSRFFHQATLRRRSANRIRHLVNEEGDLIDDHQGIRDLMYGFFQARWTEVSGTGGPVIPVLQSCRISEAENGSLIRPFSSEDIRLALWELGPEKAPGPDGFPPLFFRHYWHIVGTDVVQAIQTVFQSSHMPSDWKKTLVTLVPKRPGASSPLHFRPISLCSTLYKICARLLVDRLTPVIPRLISQEQGAFLRGRCITDNALLAQEFMHDLQRAPSSQCLMAIKLDMERAYDRLRWDFLYCTLREFGIHEDFITWVMECILRPSFSLLINGDRTEFFHSEVGLRQGCPLSPFLFILAADALSRDLAEASRTMSIHPYLAGPLGPSLSHLLFADDCLLLGKASISNATSFATILHSYCEASGQSVNLSKSSICFSPKTAPSLKRAISCLLGIPAHSDHLTYLGIPITGKRPRCSDFSFIVRRIRDRLDRWQVTGLSMMARITLIRSVLSSIPSYLLANTAIPVTCLRRIEREFRQFLWASNQDGVGIHLIDWDTVCLPPSEGGLGIHSLVVRRQAMTARHASRFLLDPHCLWSSFMRAKYGGWTESTPDQSSRGHSFFWKEVCRFAPSLLHSTSWMIGNGTMVDSVRDTWIADLPLSRWPTFVSSDMPEGLKVSDFISSGRAAWSLSRLSSFFGDELCRRISSIPISPVADSDIRVWRRSCLTRVPLRDLMSMYRPSPRDSMEVDWVWHLNVHPRVRLFIWKVAWDILPTCSLLAGRGISISPMCPLCGLVEETTDHALFSCPRATQIWHLCGTCPWLVQSGFPRGVFLRSLQQDRGRAGYQRGSLWAYIGYQIWLSRNRILFSSERPSPSRVFRTALSLFTEFTSHHRLLETANPGHWVSPAAEAANRHTVFISWEPPPLGFVKVNFDGSVRGRSAGSAFVIRDGEGKMVAAGGFGLLDVTVPLAELYAAWAGITYAVRILRASSIIIEGDSIIVIRWIQQESRFFMPSIPILYDIRSMLAEAPNTQIHHIFREANAVADWIAARVATHSGCWKWIQGDPVPALLSHLLYSDISGLYHSRVV